MEKRKRRFAVDFIILMLAIAITVALRTIAAVRNLDIEFGYYFPSSVIKVANWFVFFFVLVLFTIGYISGKDKDGAFEFSSPASFIPTGIMSVSLLLLAAATVSFVARRQDARGGLFSDPAALFAVLCAAFAIVSIFSLFFYVLNPEAQNEKRAKLSLALPLTLILYAVYLYFNTSLPINAPNKIIDQTAYVFSAMFFLFESRISFGKEKRGAYSAFGYAAVLLTSYSSLPSIAVFLINGNVISNSIAETALTFSLFIFIFARLILLSELEGKDKCDLVTALSEKAESRAAFVDESDAAFLEANQAAQGESESAQAEAEAQPDGLDDGSFNNEPTELIDIIANDSEKAAEEGN